MKMKATSLDAFAEMVSDGTLSDSFQKAYDLVEQNPGCTVTELLNIGVNEGIYPYPNKGFITPRITEMVKEGIIIRPRKKPCTISKKMALINELAPIEWLNKHKVLKQHSRGKIVKNLLEIESKTTEGVFHTVIEWHDGTIYCSCNYFYKRPGKIKCHHIEGIRVARGDLCV